MADGDLQREVPLNVTVPEGLRRLVKSVAAKEGMSIREFTRMALAEKLARQGYVITDEPWYGYPYSC